MFLGVCLPDIIWAVLCICKLTHFNVVLRITWDNGGGVFEYSAWYTVNAT